MRGCFDIPIHDRTDVFTWGKWVSLSEQSFHRMSELWDAPGRESESPFFGRLCTRLPGERPFIELEPTDHALAVEQRSGISLARVREIGESLLHGPSA